MAGPTTRSPERSAVAAPSGRSPLSDAAAADLGTGFASRWDRRPTVSVRRLVTRFALAGVPALAAVIVITALASVRIGTRLGIADAKRTSFVAATVVEDLGLDDGVLTLDQASTAKLDEVVHRYVLRGSLLRVKLHDRNGMVLYSNESALVGRTFAVGPEEIDVLEGRIEVEAETSDLSKEENAFETEKRLLEVYRRIETPNGTPVLFEAYFRYDDISDTGRDLWTQFAPIAVGALLVLELVQIPFAISLARRVRHGQQQRERLLQHAIEASDAERRRIASDLHDGAVQDLTGVSMSLAASSRSTDDPAAQHTMSDAGAKIRETVKSLRSMLVDIYPPNLYEEGLQSALADLLGALHNRGVRTRLEVDGAAVTLPRQAVSLLYRSAQEALRNVAAHAQATEVAVVVTVDDATASLVVDDDGRGFDPDTLGNRARRGHVGLRSLVGLIQDAGGRIEIRSLPSVGTRVEVTLPR